MRYASNNDNVIHGIILRNVNRIINVLSIIYDVKI